MGKLTLVTPPPAEEGNPEFWLREPEQMDGNGDWGFEIFGADHVFIAEFVYAEEVTARAAPKTMRAALKDVVFVGMGDE